MICANTFDSLVLSPNRTFSSPIYDQKVEYVLLNPVTSGYVTDETDWKYSSAGKFSPLILTEGGEEFTGQRPSE